MSDTINEPLNFQPAGDDSNGSTGSESTEVLAEPINRLFAVLIDLLCLTCALFPGLLMIIAFDEDSNSIIVGIILLAIGALSISIYQIVLLSREGQTIGKRIMKIRIVHNKTGENPGFAHAVVLRSFVPGLIGNIPYLGTVFGIVDILFIFGQDRRCIHDHMADTKVVEI